MKYENMKWIFRYHNSIFAYNLKKLYHPNVTRCESRCINPHPKQEMYFVEFFAKVLVFFSMFNVSSIKRNTY